MNEAAQLEIPGTQPQGNDALRTLVRLCNKLAALEDDIETRTAELQKVTDEAKNISERLVPDLMASIGLTEMRLTDGRKITIKEDTFVNVTKENLRAAGEWLKERNMGGIVKEKVIVSPEYTQRLVEAVVPFTTDVSIHPSSLRALVKEQLEAGTQFPPELFGVHVANKAVIKTA